MTSKLRALVTTCRRQGNIVSAAQPVVICLTECFCSQFKGCFYNRLSPSSTDDGEKCLQWTLIMERRIVFSRRSKSTARRTRASLYWWVLVLLTSKAGDVFIWCTEDCIPRWGRRGGGWWGFRSRLVIILSVEMPVLPVCMAGYQCSSSAIYCRSARV